MLSISVDIIQIALSGSNSQSEREAAVERLEMECNVDEKGRPVSEQALDYIFTVDIFNEGVDIPQVNQVIMLRPTQSAIVFVQQLVVDLERQMARNMW